MTFSGPFIDSLMIHRTPFFVPWFYPGLLWRMSTHQKEIYLTFDDGPVPGATEFALHTLARFNAKATFFCIGYNIQKYPEIFRKIISDGHAVGNHTYNHLNGWTTDNDRYFLNIQVCHEEIVNQRAALVTHNEEGSKLFRPPYGRITRKQIKGLDDYKIVMWDVLSFDYNKNIAPHSCLLHTVNATRPGSIVVFHDSYKAERNMAFVLPRFIEHFAEKGYAFKSISG
jgi:peptidoglycan/xylan/chitin deacetylase (PgdA/CDA1 family)